MSVDSMISVDEDCFAEPRPKREWLVHCENSDGDVAVCEITVNRGEIEFTGPGKDSFTLTPSDVVEFRDAFVAALSQATADIRAAQ